MDTLNRPVTWIMAYDVIKDLNPAGYEFSAENASNDVVVLTVDDNRYDVRTRAMIDLAVSMLSRRGYRTRRTNAGRALHVRNA